MGSLRVKDRAVELVSELARQTQLTDGSAVDYADETRRFAEFAQRAQAIIQGEPTDAPRFAVIVDGGLVVDVVSHDPAFIGASYATIDMDTEGLTEGDEIAHVPTDDGKTKEAYVRYHTVESRPALAGIDEWKREVIDAGEWGDSPQPNTAPDMTTRAQLLKERNTLMNSFGDGPRTYGGTRDRIAAIDRELMLSECDIATLNAGGTID